MKKQLLQNKLIKFEKINILIKVKLVTRPQKHLTKKLIKANFFSGEENIKKLCIENWRFL